MRRGALGVILASLIAAPAAAQSSSSPGPWVLDVRAVTSPVPDDVRFYPTLSSATVPSRGYGVDLGAHVYLFDFGPTRVGFGASVLSVRSTATSTITLTAEDGTTSVTDGQRLTLTMRVVVPQVSFNFGTRDGWSYLSAGGGAGAVDTRAENVLPASRDSGWRRSLNFGGGARWFFKPRLAFGFDLRYHHLSAGAAGDVVLDGAETVPSTESTPSVSAFSVSAGLSFR